MSICLTFDEIRYSTENKEILKGISGHINAGEMLVILGPSGCGKTTLLNILSSNISPDKYTGSVKINGKAPSRITQKETAYVKQTVVINPHLTVRENLEYTAKFRVPKEHRQNRINRIIDQFGLAECQNTPTGSDNYTGFGKNQRGVSGGERRRAYIAQEILTSPSLIFLDEPTSGLDYFSALSVLTVIKALASQQQCAVILTLHQPSSDMSAMFDKLMLMVSGKVAYFGKALDALNFFVDAGMPCKQYYNPADHFLTKLSDLESATTLVSHYTNKFGRPIERELQDLEKGNSPISNDELILRPISRENAKLPREPIQDSERYVSPHTEQFKTLLKRSATITWRSFNPATLVITLIIAIFIGFCAIRRRSLTITDAEIPILNTVIFLGYIYGVGFMPTINAISLFLPEAFIIEKELKNGSYNSLIYFIAKRLGETPVGLLQPLLYVLIIYFMVGLRLDVYMLAHIGVMMISGCIAYILGIFYATITRDNQGAILLQALYAIISLLTMGYYIAISRLPVWIRWLQWVQFYRYGYESLLQIEYTGKNIRHIAGSNFLSQENLEILGNNTHYGTNLLYSQLGIKLTIGQDIGALCGYWGLFEILTFICIYFLIVRKK